MRCRIYQWRLSRSLATAGGELPTALRSHLERCGPCRQYRGRLTALEADLRDDAPDAPPLRAELRGRILAAVAAEPPAAAVRRPQPRRLVIRIAVGSLAAAACLAAAFALYQVLRPEPTQEPGPPIVKPDGNQLPSLPLLAVADELPRMLIDDVDQLVAPVTDEMRRMADQTRRLGSSLLAQLPLGLIDEALPDPPAREKPATTRAAETGKG